MKYYEVTTSFFHTGRVTSELSGEIMLDEKPDRDFKFYKNFQTEVEYFEDLEFAKNYIKCLNCYHVMKKRDILARKK